MYSLSIVHSYTEIALYDSLNKEQYYVPCIYIYIAQCFVATGKLPNKGTEGVRFCILLELVWIFVYLYCIINFGDRLLVHCTEGNCSLEVTICHYRRFVIGCHYRRFMIWCHYRRFMIGGATIEDLWSSATIRDLWLSATIGDLW